MLNTIRSLKGLSKFAEREPWCDCLADLDEDHLGLFLEMSGMEADGLLDFLGDDGSTLLFCCIMDDFMTQEFDVGGGNVVDDYIKRRGWKETARSRAYLKAVRWSVMSLYEITDGVSGRTLMLRDLIRGGEPVAVSEERGGKAVDDRCTIAARVVSVRDEHRLANGVPPFIAPATDMLFDGLRMMFGDRDSPTLPPLEDDDLRLAAPLFTNAWLGSLMLAGFEPGKANAMSPA